MFFQARLETIVLRAFWLVSSRRNDVIFFSYILAKYSIELQIIVLWVALCKFIHYLNYSLLIRAFLRRLRKIPDLAGVLMSFSVEIIFMA